MRSGMSAVPEWLKSLRLHKYTGLMMSLTYEEMLDLSEEKLEKMGVTKGARRKIVSSVGKLRDRFRLLSSLQAELENADCDLKKILLELEGVVKSPIQVDQVDKAGVDGVEAKSRHNSARDSGTEVSGSEDEEVEEELETDGRALVERIVITLRKVCSHVLLSQDTDIKNVVHLALLLELCLARPVYPPHSRQLLLSWRQRILSVWGPLPPPGATPTTWNSTSPRLSAPHSAPLAAPLKTFENLKPLKSPSSSTAPASPDSLSQCGKPGLLLQRRSAPCIRSWWSDHSSGTPPASLGSPGLLGSPASSTFTFPSPPPHPLMTPHSPTPSLLSSHSSPPPPSSIFSSHSNSPPPTLISPSLPPSHCSPTPTSHLATHTNSPNRPPQLQLLEQGCMGAPLEPVTNIFVTSPESPADSELNTRLESLCLSVTEHALS